jgi:NTP pyrophosphatase (non-canonical NTP hydrolase)
MTAYSTLREANLARQAEWDAGNQITRAYRADELAGEMGEACNVIKKLERERMGIRGSHDTVAHLAEELADIVICADLVAMDARSELQTNTGWPAGIVTGDEWGTFLAVCVGRLCNNILFEKKRYLTVPCMDVERAARGAAMHYGIDLDAAVQAKFNATSEKVGLATRLAA